MNEQLGDSTGAGLLFGTICLVAVLALILYCLITHPPQVEPLTLCRLLKCCKGN